MTKVNVIRWIPVGLLILGCNPEAKPVDPIALARDSVMRRPVDMSRYDPDSATRIPPERMRDPDSLVGTIQPESIPALPEWLAHTLSRGGCRVPRMTGSTRPGNFLRGRFRDASESVWAVTCVSGGHAGTLVFHGDSTLPPDSLNWSALANEADRYLDHGTGHSWEWTRELSSIDSTQARRFCRAGQVEPLHAGIIEFSYQMLVGAHYFEEGRWHTCPDWPVGD